MREEAKTQKRQSGNRMGLASPTSRSPRKGARARGADLDDKIAKEKARVEELQRSVDSAEFVFRELRLRKQARELTLTKWPQLIEVVDRVFRSYENDGTLEISRLLDEFAKSEQLACLASLQSLRRVSRFQRITKAGFLSKIRPKLRSDKRTLQLEVVLGDLETSIQTRRADFESLKRQLLTRQRNLKTESAKLRRVNAGSAKKTKTLRSQLDEANRAGEQLRETEERLEEEAAAVGPSPTPTKAATIRRSKERLEAEKDKLEISLAAMMSVKDELSGRLARARGQTEAQAEAIEALQKSSEDSEARAERSIRDQDAEIGRLRDSLGLGPRGRAPPAAGPDGRTSPRASPVVVESVPAESGPSEPAGDIGRKLAHSSRLVDARINVSLRNLEAAETKMLAGLRESQWALGEVSSGVKALREVLTLPGGDDGGDDGRRVNGSAVGQGVSVRPAP